MCKKERLTLDEDDPTTSANGRAAWNPSRKGRENGLDVLASMPVVGTAVGNCSAMASTRFSAPNDGARPMLEEHEKPLAADQISNKHDSSPGKNAPIESENL